MSPRRLPAPQDFRPGFLAALEYGVSPVVGRTLVTFDPRDLLDDDDREPTTTARTTATAAVRIDGVQVA